MAGKGSRRRVTLVSRGEYDLRWALAYGKISFDRFEAKMKKIKQERRR